MKLLLVLAAAVAAADILLLLPMGLHVRYAAGALSFAVLAGPVPVRRMQKAGKVRRAGGKSALGRIPPAVLIRTARRCRGREFVSAYKKRLAGAVTQVEL